MRTMLHAFAFDRRGNFGIISAVLAVPLVLSVALAIDFTKISSKRSALQQAADSAVMAIAREGKDVSDKDAQLIASKFIDGNLALNGTTFQVLKQGTHFAVNATVSADLSFGALLGYQNWPVKVAATADIAYASYEIALVLDTTGSMKGGKLIAMQDAVTGLIDSMSAQVKDADKLKFAMVPFAAFVNVGPNYGPTFKKEKQVPGTGADWLDLAGGINIPQSEFTTGASRFQIYKNLGKKWPGCVETRYSPGTDVDVDDTPPNVAKPGTLFIPTFAIDEPDSGYPNSYITSDATPGTMTAAEKKKRWKKYGVDTDAAGNPLNGGLLSAVTGLLIDPLTGDKSVVLDPNVASEVASNTKGPGAGCDVQEIVPLTNDYKKLQKKVGQLQANGTTNIMEGVAWGNRVLSPGVPFTESVAGKDTTKIMIVLTDGTNNFGANGSSLGSTYSAEGYLIDGRLGISSGGSSATTSKLDGRTLAACDVAKKAGVEIYTIRLEEPNVATGNMLKECASAEDHYIDVPNRTQLDEAFGKIKENIVRIRMSS